MNRIYRIVWNTSIGAWVAVSENAKSKTKTKTVKVVSVAITIASSAVMPVYADVLAGNNITITSNGTDIVVATKDDVSLNKVTVGSVELDKTSNTVKVGTNTTLSTAGLNTNGSVNAGTLTTTGSATIGNGLTVADGATALKNTSITGTLTTTENTTVGGTLGVTGATTLNNTLNVVGNTTLSNVTTTGSATIGNGLTVSNGLTVANGTTALKNTNITGTLSTTGNTTVGGTLNVNGLATFNNGANLNNKKITGLAAGNINNASSTDAVNGGQLYTVNNNIADALGTQLDANGVLEKPTYTVSDGKGGTQSFNNIREAIEYITGVGTTGTGGVGVGIKYFHTNSAAADSQSKGLESVAIGPQAIANGTSSIAMGDQARAEQENSVAIGKESAAIGLNSTAIGSTTGKQRDPVYTLDANKRITAIDGISVTTIGAGTELTDITAINGVPVTNAQVNSFVASLRSGANLSLGKNSMALGTSNFAAGESSVALGDSSKAVAKDAIAIGRNGNASGVQAISIGAGAQAAASGALAAGGTSNAGRDGAVALGQGAFANTTAGISIGQNAGARTSQGTTNDRTDHIAIGRNSGQNVIGNRNIALGIGAGSNLSVGGNDSSDDNIAIGVNAGSNLNGDDNIAIGRDANKNITAVAESVAIGSRVDATTGSTVLGNEAKASGGDYATVLGYKAKVTGDSGTALGRDSEASTNNIALGASSVANGTSTAAAYLTADIKTGGYNIVSVGQIGQERRITNVAAGANPTDAVNVNQLYEAQKNVASLIGGQTGVDSTTGGFTGYIIELTDKTTGVTHQYKDVSSAIKAVSSGEISVLPGNAVTYTADGRISNIAAGTQAKDAVNLAQLNQAIADNGQHHVSINSKNPANKNNTGASADESLAIGAGVTTSNAGVKSVVIGFDAATNAKESVAIGNTSTQANGDASIAIGKTALAKSTNNIAMGTNASSNGMESIAIGTNIQIDKTTGISDYAVGIGSSSEVQNADQAIAIGRKAIVQGDNGTAIGHESRAANENASALGNFAKATAVSANAIGNYATASGTSANAIGDNAKATASNANAMGKSAEATSTSSNAIGDRAKAAADNASAIGTNAQATGVNANAMGNGAKASEQDASAIGTNAKATGLNANAIGTGAQALRQDTLALGTSAVASGLNASAIGKSSDAAGLNANAFGNGAKAGAESSNAIGTDANVSATNGFALGTGATVTHTNAIALGSGSISGDANPTESAIVNGKNYNYAGTNPTSTVSVGSVGNERQIINVAAGRVSASSTDAINGSQLFRTNEELANLANKTAQALGGGASANQVTGAISAPSYTVTTNPAGTGTKTTVSDVGAALTALDTAVNQPLSFAGDTGTQISRKLGETLNVKGGATGTLAATGNIGVVANGTNQLDIRLAETINLGNNGSVTTGSASIKNNEVKVGTNTLTNTGLKAGNVRVNTSTNDVTGLSNTTWNPAGTYNSGRAATEEQLLSAQNQLNTTLTDKGFSISAQGANSDKVKLGETVDFRNTDGNLVATRSADNTINYDLAKNINVDKVTLGNIVIDKATGINAGNQKITNVKAGDVNSTSTDAINGSQLYAVASKLGEQVENTYFHVNNGTNAGTGNATTNLGKITDAAGAQATGALAAGINTIATGKSSVSIGDKAQAKADNDIAIGTLAGSGRGDKGSTYAVGTPFAAGTVYAGGATQNVESIATNSGISIGQNSGTNSTGVNNTMIGTAAGEQLFGDNTVTIGTNANNYRVNGFSNGQVNTNNNTVDALSGNTKNAANAVNHSRKSVAIGNNAMTYDDSNIAIGDGAKSLGASSIAMGTGARAGMAYATVGGVARGDGGSIAIGKNSVAPLEGDLSIGVNTGSRVNQNTIPAHGMTTTRNISVGYDVGGNVYGYTNTVIGTSSGSNIGTAAVPNYANVAIGDQVGKGIRGNNNVNIGYQGGNNITSNSNTSIGSRSGSHVSGANNVTTGTFSGNYVSGTDNWAAGVESGTHVGVLSNASSLNINDNQFYAGSTQLVKRSATANVAAGKNAGQYINGSRNIAFGQNAGQYVGHKGTTFGAVSNNNIAMGEKAGQYIEGSDNFAVGLEAGRGTGTDATLTRHRSISQGFKANAYTNDSIAIGSNSVAGVQSANGAGKINAIAIGTGAQATGKQSISVGTGNVVSGDNSGAFGDTTTISGTGSYSTGNNNTITTNDTFVVGSNVTKTLDNSVFLGKDAAYTAKGASTDGIGAVTEPVTVGSTLTYGDFAGKTPVGVVSVGDVGKERRIQNMAAGLISATSTDAINGSQLYATNAKLGNVANTVVKNFGGNATLDADGNITYTNIGNTGKDNIHDAIQAATTVVKAGTNVVVDEATNATTGQKEYTVNAWDTTVSAAADSAVTVTPTIDDTKRTRAYEVTVNTDGNTIKVENGKLTANTTPLTNTDGKVNTPAAPDALATAGDIANAINNSGWKATSGATGSGVVDGTTEELINPSETVKFQAGDNMVLNQAENVFTYSLNKDININSVQFNNGPKITNDGDNIKVGDKDGNATKITNVAAGTDTNDAVNKGQLDAVIADQAAADALNVKYDSTTKDKVTLGGAGSTTPVQVSNVKAGELSATSTDAVNGSQLYATNQNVTTAQNTADTALTEAQKGIKFGDGVSSNQYALGDTLNVKGSADGSITSTTTADGVQLGLGNIVTVGTSNPVSINGTTGTIGGLSNTSWDVNNIVSGQAATEDQLALVEAKVTDLDDLAVKYDSITKDQVTLGGAGSTTPVQVSNVKAGELSATSTDAVNGSQLYATNQNVTTAQNTADTALTEAQKGIKFGDGVSSNQYALGDTLNVKGSADGSITSTTTADGVQLGLGNIVTVGTSNPVSINGTTGTIGGLSNTSWDVNNIVSGQAATEDQLALVEAKVTDLDDLAVKYDSITKDQVTLGGAGSTTPVQVSNVKAGDVNSTSTDAVNGSQLYTAQDNVKNVLGSSTQIDAAGNLTSTNIGGVTGANTVHDAIQQVNNTATNAKTQADKGLNFAVNGVTPADNVQLGETVNFADGTNTTATYDAATNTYKYSLNDTLSLSNAGSLSIKDSAGTGTVVSVDKTGVQSGSIKLDASTGKITGVTDGLVAAGSKEAVNGSQLDAVKAIANTGWKLTTDKTGTGAVAGSSVEQITPDETVTFIAGDNIAVEQAGNKVTVATKKDVVFDSVTAGGTVINNSGLSFVDSAGTLVANSPSISKTGINAGNQKITNVKAGDVNSTSTDAVNGSQLFATNQNVDKNTSDIATNATNITKNASDISTLNTTVTNQGNEITTLKGGFNLQTNGTNTGAIKAGDTVDIGVADPTDSNLTATKTGNNVAFALSKDLTLDSVTTGNTVMNNAGITTDKVTVGNVIIDKSTNKISGIEAGTDLKDAVNKSQLDALAAQQTTTDNAAVKYDDATAKDKVTLAGATGTTLTNVKAGDVSATSTDAVNGSQLFATNQNVDKNTSDIATNATNITKNASDISTLNTTVTNQGNEITTLKGGFNLQTNGTNTGAIKAGDTVDIGVADPTDSNLTATKTGNNVAFALSKDLTLDSVTTGQLAVGNVAIDSTTNTIKGLSNKDLTAADFATQGRAATEEQLKQVISKNITEIVDGNGNKVNIIDQVVNTQPDNKNQDSLFLTYNKQGQETTDRLTIAETVQKMNTEGVKFFHTNADTSKGDLGTTNDSSAGGLNSTAIGVNAIVEAGADSSVALGHNTKVAGAQSIAIGNGAEALGTQSISIGNGNKVNGDHSGAIGDPTIVDGSNSYSVGNNNQVLTDDTFVLGNNVTQTVVGSVVLGTGSAATTGAGVAGYTLSAATTADKTAISNTTSTTGALAVGDAANGIYRQITGVAAGTADADAVNVAQLKAVGNQVVETQTALVDSLGGNAKVNADGTITGPTYNVAQGTQTNVGDALTALDQAIGNAATTSKTTVSNGENIIVNKTKNADGSDNYEVSTAKDLTVDSVAAGDTVLNNSGINIGNNAVVLNNTGLVIAGGPSVTTQGINAGNKQITNVAAGTSATDAVNKGQLDTAISNVNNNVNALANNAVKYDDANKDKITLGGANGTTISNVKDGEVAQGSKDAVNGGQLWNVQQQVNQNTSNISNIQTNIDNINSGKSGLVQQQTPNGEITVGKDTGGTTVNVAGKNGDRVVTGVKDGAIKADSKDAVNGSQLNTTNQKIAEYLGGGAGYDNITQSFTNPTYNVGGKDYNNVGGAVDALNKADQALNTKIDNVSNRLEQAFYSTNQRIDDVEKRANAGIAAAMALENAPYIPGKYTYAAGAAYHGGENAIGLTLRKTADNGRWSLTGGVAAGSSGDPSVRVGISGVID